MAQEKIDYAAALADAKAKRASLDALIASLEHAQATGALGQPSEGGTTFAGSGITGTPIDLPINPFMDQSVSNSIKLYLEACRKKQTVREIATALKEGGIESTSKNFEIIVGNSLRLLKKANIVLQFKDGWALAKFFPDQIRARLASQDSSNKKRVNKRGRKAKQQKQKEAKSKVLEMPKAV